MHHLDLTTIDLHHGSHTSPDQGHMLVADLDCCGSASRPYGDSDDPCAFCGTDNAKRFWRRVRWSESCWEWIGGTCPKGYGTLRIDGGTRKAHRVAYELTHGPIPEDGPGYHGWCVMHSCDNPTCCNPTHLSLGTVADNNGDRHAKGRSVLPTNGPDYWRAKTNCPRGHAYDEENTRYRKDGRRYCGECSRQRSARYTRDHAQERNARRRAARKASR